MLVLIILIHWRSRGAEIIDLSIQIQTGTVIPHHTDA